MYLHKPLFKTNFYFETWNMNIVVHCAERSIICFCFAFQIRGSELLLIVVETNKIVSS